MLNDSEPWTVVGLRYTAAKQASSDLWGVSETVVSVLIAAANCWLKYMLQMNFYC